MSPRQSHKPILRFGIGITVILTVVAVLVILASSSVKKTTLNCSEAPQLESFKECDDEYRFRTQPSAYLVLILPAMSLGGTLALVARLRKSGT